MKEDLTKRYKVCQKERNNIPLEITAEPNFLWLKKNDNTRGVVFSAKLPNRGLRKQIVKYIMPHIIVHLARSIPRDQTQYHIKLSY